MPTIICHIIWMDKYEGPEETIFAGGFDFPQEHGYGHELFNFLTVNQRCFGYVQTRSGVIDISKLGAEREDTFIDGVTVIWTAPRQTGGRFVVGWYDNARVYRNFQTGSVRGRRHEGLRVGYMVEALASDAVRLPPEARTLEVPHHGPGLPGTSSVFYPDGKPQMVSWLQQASAFMESYAREQKPNGSKGGSGPARQPDHAHRAAVEAAAINETIAQLGAVAADRQKDNCGWDLEFLRGGERLCVEVKGLSGETVAVELTPNEYTALRRSESGEFLEGAYRLAVVTHALEDSPRFFLFEQDGPGRWKCERTGTLISVEERAGARLS